MSKMRELVAELAELRRCGETLISISETLTEMFSSTDSGTEKPEKKSAGKTAAVQEPEKKSPTLEKVWAVLPERSRAGHTAEVKALLVKFGAGKLSEIEPSKYEPLLVEAEVLRWVNTHRFPLPAHNVG